MPDASFMSKIPNLTPEPRKHTILPRNHDNFSEASYFFSEEFYTLWSFSPRIGGTYHFRSSFFHTFVFNLWKNQAEYSISVVKYQIFLLFIKIFLGTRFLGSSKNLDSEAKIFNKHPGKVKIKYAFSRMFLRLVTTLCGWWMSSKGGTTLWGGELSLGGVAPSLFGLIHPKNVDSQPQRAVTTHWGRSFS